MVSLVYVCVCARVCARACARACVCVCVCRINDRNERNTQKRQERTNVGELGTTRIMTASVHYVASAAGLRKMKAV